jgi:hypothetical protein
MAELNGKELSKSQLFKNAVNINQIASIDEVELKDGRANGMKVFRVRSANGLAFDLLPSKCLDISALSYKGVNISLLTRNGVCSPENISPSDGEFERYFGGGMLWTGGLKNCGPNYRDDNSQFHHYHGRIGTLPAEQSWKRSYFDGDDYILAAGATMRDTTIEGYNLELVREVKTSLSKPEILISDSIENLDYNDTDYLLLYHFNFGFPFIDEGLKMVFPDPEKPVIPGNKESEKSIPDWNKLGPPIENANENLFFHSLKADDDNTATVKLENSNLGIGVYIRYETTYLPFLVEWKCMRAGEYALGIEPANNLIQGMKQERRSGRSKKIAAGEKHEIKVALGFYSL